MKNVLSEKQIPMFGFAVLIIFAVCSIIVSHVIFGVSVVVACVMFMMESLLAACFNQIPLWIHGIIFIAQVVAGIIAGQTVFMVLMAIIYAIAIVFLHIWESNEQN